MIAAILTMAVFVLLQRSFEGLVLDAYSGSIAVAVCAGAGAYLIYQSVSDITTRKMSSMLVAFMAISVLTSIATAQDPAWWEYHFSQLGTAGDFSSSLFNLALIVAGFFVTTFALYLNRDLTTLVERGVLQHPTAPRTISVIFIIMGLMLAGVGAFPVNVSMPLHNLCATGMAIAFSVMVLGSPRILAGLPRRFFVFCIGTFVVLIGSFLLFEPVGLLQPDGAGAHRVQHHLRLDLGVHPLHQRTRCSRRHRGATGGMRSDAAPRGIRRLGADR